LIEAEAAAEQQRVLNNINDGIGPDVAENVVTGPSMDLSHQPMVTVSAWAGVARKVASTRISFFTEHLLPPSTPRQLQLAAFVAACPKNAAQDFHYFFGQTISRIRKGSDCDLCVK
jgi:hypothetical protein